MAQNEASHWWFKGRRKIIYQVMRHITDIHDSPQILDAGCGSGGNLDLLKTFGSVSAFEHDATARDVATVRSGVNVRPGTLPSTLPTYDTKFDIIVLFDVLEHIVEDRQSLEVLKEQLDQDGSFLITVPALPELWSDHDITHQHKRRYTRTSLTETCEEAGLSVRDVRYFNTLLLPLAKWHRKRSVARKLSSNEDQVPPLLVNYLLFAVFAIESHLFRFVRFPSGLSLIAIATKN